MPTIKVIIGSTRPSRFGTQPAEWIMELAKNYPQANFELIDLAEVNLPMLDEPIPAAFSQYTKDHTKAWASIIDEADGYIFITPEYNHSIPASLKNAIDFLAQEWRYKPVAFVSYGYEAAGIRAVEHLRASVANLSMYDIRESVSISLTGQPFSPSEQHIESANIMLERIAFWSEFMKPAREELKKK